MKRKSSVLPIAFLTGAAGRLLLLAPAVFILLLAGCSKSNDGANNNNNNNNNGPSTTKLIYVNDTYTPIAITVNGVTSSIAVGGSLTYTGTAGTQLSGAAHTSGLTSTGNVVGQVINWTISDQFPSSGSGTKTLDVGSNYFFLKVNNTSMYTITGVYVNFGLVPQTFDNITFGYGLFNIGYYPAYANSNVRCISGGFFWQAYTNLSNAQNQEFLFTLTN
ncbi:MAG TPA: hypothetical protein VKQ52_07860 [Puia sp.]|nr:hypothetical protein [Puia sp.]